MNKPIKYPHNAEFAFTILDDTDDTTVLNGKPVYNLLKQLGFRTTKTVWALNTTKENSGPYFAGETLTNPSYLEWVRELHKNNFEIAFHNATMGTSIREDTIKALDIIEKEFGNIRLHCNHGQNLENLHWGKKRYSNLFIKHILNLVDKVKPFQQFEGDNPNSSYYWADICDEHITYMRAFAYSTVNCNNIIPGRPFLDKLKQKQTLFFNTVDAPDIKAFNKLITPESINRLRSQGGWTIISTHFGKGFYWKNKLNPEFKKNMEYIASLPGWFVPASELLDHIAIAKGTHVLSPLENFRMEMHQLIDRVKSKLFNQPFTR